MAVVVSLQHRRGELSDRELVLAARRGDGHAQAALYDRHVRMAAGLAYRLLGRSDDLEDLLQDAFVAAFEGLDRLQDPQAFARWLGSIVVRQAQRRIGRMRLRRRFRIAPAAPCDLEGLVSPGAPPDIAAELRGLYAIVDGLPAEERIALVLRRVEGLTVPEIAEQMDLSIATVKRRLQAAEARLRARMKAPRKP